MEVDLADFEHELCRLPEVEVARLVSDDTGRLVEVHVVATLAKHAKQVARDVQSVAIASFGMEIDHRIISVVQLDGNGVVARNGDGPPASRVTIGATHYEPEGHQATANVVLRREDDTVQGVARGSAAASLRPRLFAEAALDALRQLLPLAERADVETAGVLRIGLRDVAVAVVVFAYPSHEEVISGSAVVREEADGRAAVRAVLDATNRRLQAVH